MTYIVHVGDECIDVIRQTDACEEKCFIAIKGLNFLTIKRCQIQDVSFLLGKSCHNQTENHPQEVVHIEEAMEDKKDCDDSA